MKAQSYWLASSSPSAYPALNKDLDVQVLVIGGGVTGLTTAFFLAQAGMKVALVERSRLGGGDSGHTTAHLTYMTDTRLSTLVKQVGQDHALAAWDAGAHAMNVIQSLVEENHISCEFRTIPGFLALEEDTKSPQEGRSLLIEEADLASRHGLDIAFEEQLAPTRACGNRFSNQFKFHPLKYLQALAKEASAMGASIFENTAVAEFKEDSRSVVANGHIIRFEQVVIATHTPLQGNAGTLGALLFQTKLYAYSTYAIQATVPSGSLPEMIWSDTADPFLYLRVDRGSGHDIAILGGKDHKTGQVDDTEACYQALSATLLRWVPDGGQARSSRPLTVCLILAMQAAGTSSPPAFPAMGTPMAPWQQSW